MNTLYYGDNLKILRKYVDDESVDLIYLDPPFNSKRAYNVIFKDQTGKDASAQIQAFEDTWSWKMHAQGAFDEIMAGNYPAELKNVLNSFKGFLGINNLMSYLTMMAIRLVELHRVLKGTGSVYLHCDPTASHYLKILMDQIFGVENFRNEVIWRRTNSHNKLSKQYGPIHDILLFYSKKNKFFFNPGVTPYFKNYIEKRFIHEDDRGRYQLNYLTGSGIRTGESGREWRGFNPTEHGRHWAIPRSLLEFIPYNAETMTTIEKLELLNKEGLIIFPKKEKGQPFYKQYIGDGTPYQDLWAYQPNTQGVLWGQSDCIDQDVKWLEQEDEKLGFQTQKPLGLLERIIKSSSPLDGLVMDPFCGCGTAVAAAEKLGRSWIGIDITHLAISLIKKRLMDHFPDVQFKVEGEPESVDAARELFKHSAFQFEAWAVSLLGGQPYKSRGGGDTGIDGLLYFKDYKGTYHKIIIEVKGGGYQPKDIRSLGHVMKREEAPLGVLIALNPPTKGMLSEAAALGSWQLPGGRKSYPKLQIFTIQDYYDGKVPDLPDTSMTLKKAKRELREGEKTKKLNL